MKATLAVLVSVGALIAGCDRDALEVRTFRLERLQSDEISGLIDPYVYSDREGAPGHMSWNESVLTVRELPENLDRIAAVLAEYDRARASVRLHFQLIEADGFTETDESIRAVEGELRKLLRYRGYRLVGEAVLQLQERGEGNQTLQGSLEGQTAENSRFGLSAEVGVVTHGDGSSSVELWVGLYHFDNPILNTRVSGRDGQSMVLGTTSPLVESGALILVVTPTIEEG